MLVTYENDIMFRHIGFTYRVIKFFTRHFFLEVGHTVISLTGIILTVWLCNGNVRYYSSFRAVIKRQNGSVCMRTQF